MPVPVHIFDPPFNIIRASHVVLDVTNLDTSREFYETTIGLHVEDRDEDALYLRGSEEHQHHSLVLRLGEGRDLATRKKAGEQIFKVLSAYLDPVFAESKFALSFDMQINDKETSWKRNNIHEALQAEPAHG